MLSCASVILTDVACVFRLCEDRLGMIEAASAPKRGVEWRGITSFRLLTTSLPFSDYVSLNRMVKSPTQSTQNRLQRFAGPGHRFVDMSHGMGPSMLHDAIELSRRFSDRSPVDVVSHLQDAIIRPGTRPHRDVS